MIVNGRWLEESDQGERYAVTGVKNLDSNLTSPRGSDLDVFDFELLTSSPAYCGFALDRLSSGRHGSVDENLDLMSLFLCNVRSGSIAEFIVMDLPKKGELHRERV